MNILQKKNRTEDALNRIQVKSILHFMKKENRDRAFDLVKNEFEVRKSVTNSQQLHPEYVEDYEGEIEVGFGNSMYQTYFKKIYNIVYIVR